MSVKGQWHRKRSPHVTEEEVTLQHELIKRSTTDERRQEILARLSEIKHSRYGHQGEQ